MTEQEVIKNELLKQYGNQNHTVTSLLLIDKNALDDVCLKHGNNYDDVGEVLIKLESLRDHAKTNVDTVYCEMANKYRKEAEDKGEKALSDKRTEEKVTVSLEYKQAVVTYLDFKYKTDLIKGLKESLDKVTKEIDNLCWLYSGSYSAHNVGTTIQSNTTQMRNILAEKRTQL